MTSREPVDASRSYISATLGTFFPPPTTIQPSYTFTLSLRDWRSRVVKTLRTSFDILPTDTHRSI